MGLDMYLTKEVYVGAIYKHRNVKGVIDITANGEKIDIPFDKVETICLRQASWRKANQIHRWFVENVQDGNDDGKPYYVSGEKLLELVSLCEEVLEDKNKNKNENKKAKELLPTQEGFFFGDTDYNEYYYEDLRNTIEQLKDVDELGDYEYQASW